MNPAGAIRKNIEDLIRGYEEGCIGAYIGLDSPKPSDAYDEAYKEVIQDLKDLLRDLEK